jgi:hypothetical protein
MEMTTLSNTKFEISDRRGRNKEEAVPVPVPVLQPTEESTKDWEDVAYMVVLVQSNQGPLVAGRAVGLRGDGKPFVADWFLPPIWPEDLNWTDKARERLDTFLGCSCTSASACAVHKMYLPQWIKADTQRLQLMGASGVPKAIEVMMKAEQARSASNIAIPGR